MGIIIYQSHRVDGGGYCDEFIRVKCLVPSMFSINYLIIYGGQNFKCLNIVTQPSNIQKSVLQK